MKLRFAAGLAVLSVFAGTAAFAEGTVTADLATAQTGVSKVVAANAVFTCAAQRCVAAVTTDETYSVNGCKSLAKKVGKLTSYASPKHQMSADDLAKCNAGI
ncbi:MAG TPA: hypothetical protein VG939_09090 [Caulobacteraceae bacterium]|nr:hypothetical protein [Caulobacteraceae bacterium]